MVVIPTLETPRLILRAHRLDDFEAYASIWTEPPVVRFIGGAPLTREVAWMRFLRHAGHWHHLGFGYFAVEDRATGALIGEAGFQDARRALTPSIEGTMEAGWVLTGAMHGKGLAEEAMRAALGWADSEQAAGRIDPARIDSTRIDPRRITCIIQRDHAASLHVAGKLGFSAYAWADYNDRPMVLLERQRES